MDKQSEKTKVAFRVFPEGDVIALFTESEVNGWLNSYMHLGQHGEASADLLKDLRKASPAKHHALYMELVSIGYNLEVVNE